MDNPAILDVIQLKSRIVFKNAWNEKNKLIYKKFNLNSVLFTISIEYGLQTFFSCTKKNHFWTWFKIHVS
jgi:hypothetical protein